MKQNSVVQKPGNSLKKLVSTKKVEMYFQNKNNTLWILIVDILITMIFISTVYYIYFKNDNNILKYLGYGLIALFVAFVIFRILIIVLKDNSSSITKLILLSEDGRNLETWNIKGKVSVLIGRNSRDNEVDIDLSKAEYSELVSRQHALMNFAEGKWFIEDIGSSYGTGLKRVDEERFKLDTESIYELKSGDTLYIANTKLMIS